MVPVGQTIAWLLKPGEKPPASTGPVQTGRTGAAALQMPVVEAESIAGPQGDPLAVAAAYNIRISPKARRLAKEHNVDIRQVKGTGPQGEIVAEDVLAAKGGAAPTSAKASVGKPAASASLEIGALSSIGKIMAERTTQSWTTVPHFFVRQTKAFANGDGPPRKSREESDRGLPRRAVERRPPEKLQRRPGC